MLYCVECGCCAGEIGHGWTAWICNDPDEIEPPSIAVYCPHARPKSSATDPT